MLSLSIATIPQSSVLPTKMLSPPWHGVKQLAYISVTGFIVS